MLETLDLNKFPRLAQLYEQLSYEKGYKDMKEFLCDVFSEAVLHEYKELIDELAENGKYPFPKIAGL